MNVKCLKCGAPIASSGPHICKRDPKELVAEAEAFAKEHTLELVKENLEWSATGHLVNGRMRELADLCQAVSRQNGVNMAKGMFVMMALKRFADLAEQVKWVGDVMAEHGYDGPLREACCPLRELLTNKPNWPIRGVRVDSDTVVVSVKGGNDAARQLCKELIDLIDLPKPDPALEKLIAESNREVDSWGPSA